MKAGRELYHLLVRRYLTTRREQWAFAVACLGLGLMVAGAVANAVFGFKGALLPKVGMVSECVIPNTYGISVEENLPDGNKRFSFIDVKKSLTAGRIAKDVNTVLLSSFDLLVTLKRFIPQAEQRLKCFQEGKASVVCPGGASPQVIFQTATVLDPVFWNLNSIQWRIGAILTESLGEAVAELSLKNRLGSPCFALIEDAGGKEYVLMVGKRGEVSVSSIESQLAQSLVALDKGKEGYAVEVPIPTDFVDDPYPGAFYIKLRSLPKVGKGLPSFDLQFSQGGNVETVALVYDSMATAMQWPVLGGKYMVRFQPRVHPLPSPIYIDRLECFHSSADPHTEGCHVFLRTQGRESFFSRLALGNGYAFKMVGSLLQVDYSPASRPLIFPGVLLFFAGLFLFSYSRKLSKFNSLKNIFSSPK